MSKKLQLTIPKPCHENWDAMTPIQQGKFCGSCQKQVVDFSNMSDRLVAEFFKKPSTGSVCGRFMTDQLERDIEIPKKRIPWVKYFFQFAIPAFLVSIKASSQKTQGKIQITAVAKDTVAHPVCMPMMGAVAIPFEKPVDERGLKGKVVDAETGEVLPGSIVTMTSSIGKENINVKEDGSFVLNIYRKITVYNIEVSLPGYETKNIAWQEYLKSADKSHTIRLQGKIMLKGEIAVNTCRKPFMGDTVATFLENLEIKQMDIEGRVIDEQGKPVSFASIIIGNRMNLIVADSNGGFKISKNLITVDKTLTVSSAGFETITRVIDERSESGEQLVVILKANIVLPEVVVASYQYVMGGIRRSSVTRITTGELLIQKIDTVYSDKKILITDSEEENKLLVYPNPVHAGSAINLSFKKLDEGYYQLLLVNQSGQAVYQQEIWIDAEARLLNIDIPPVAAGSYFLSLTNKKSGKRFTEKIIIQ